MHPRDRFKRNTRNRLKRKLAKKLPTNPRERVKPKKETKIAKNNLELENLDTETSSNNKYFDVNISFEKQKKKERENVIISKTREKLPPDNMIYTLRVILKIIFVRPFDRVYQG